MDEQANGNPQSNQDQPATHTFHGGNWAIVELMGHVRMAGYVTEEERFGAKMGRIEVPIAGGQFVSQWFGGGSVYRVTPTSEEVARQVAEDNKAIPISSWDYQKITAARATNNLQISGVHDDEDVRDDFDYEERFEEGS